MSTAHPAVPVRPAFVQPQGERRDPGGLCPHEHRRRPPTDRRDPGHHGAAVTTEARPDAGRSLLAGGHGRRPFPGKGLTTRRGRLVVTLRTRNMPCRSQCQRRFCLSPFHRNKMSPDQRFYVYSSCSGLTSTVLGVAPKMPEMTASIPEMQTRLIVAAMEFSVKGYF